MLVNYYVMSAQRFALVLIGQAWPIQCVDFGFARFLRVQRYNKKMRYANKFVKLKQKRPQKCDRSAKSFY
jgi:hypothetical protein